MELSANQIVLVGLLASGITYVLRLLAVWFNFYPGRGVLTVALYVIALGLGGLWTGVYLPPYSGDPVGWVAEVLALGGPVVAVATLIYNILYARVLNPLANRILQNR